MLVHPNCKVNLGLQILEKRNDSFHNIETVFYPVGLSDTLEIVADESNTLINLTGIDINPEGQDNLCLKAYNLLTRDFKLPYVRINLHKEIPAGAGLGGGSSDAAFTIKILNDLFSLNLSDDKMIDYAGKLGSDCAFFIKNKPVLAYEKGDKFSDINLSLKNYHIIIIKPDISINTKEAYSLIKSDKKGRTIKDVINKPIECWKDELINDFEPEIFKKYQELTLLKEKIYKEGAVYSSMSGSGSAVFGIFKNVPDTKPFSSYPFIWKGLLY